MVRFNQALVGLLLSSTGLVAAAEEPCGQVAEAQRKQKAENPNAKNYTVSAELAHACLTSVPFKSSDSLQLIDGLQYFWDWQTTKDFLKDPPKGYAVPGTDLEGGLAKIREKAASNAYKNEFEFQFELDALVRTVHDGHFNLAMDLIATFAFTRSELGSLVSLSDNGKNFPKIYALKDVQGGSANASAIKTIDDQDAAEWLKKFSFSGFFQDPDALYNGMLFNLPRSKVSGTGGFLTSRGLYTGNKISVGYENGAKKEFANTATFTADFAGVKDGDSFYNKFCSGKQTAASLLPLKETMEKNNRFLTASPISQPSTFMASRSLQEVKPIQESADGSVAGFFLEGKDSHIAVLHLRSFVGGADSNDPLWDYSYTISKFLADCRRTRKQKLIIDVSGNRGGTIFLGYDAFKQLLPRGRVETPFNLRAIEQFDITGTKVNYLLNHPRAPKAHEAEEQRDDIFDINSYVDPNGRKYRSWSSYFGPERVPNGNFSRPAIWDFNNIPMSLKAGGLVVSGYGNRTRVAPQAFRKEDMVIVSDGICASTCAIFSDLMTRNGMKFITTGGQPRAGPMQTVGGVKGTQVLTFRELWNVAELIFHKYSTPEEQRKLENTRLGQMVTKGKYVLGRLINDGAGGRVNYRNAVFTEDKNRVPRQFVYEKSHCRMFITKEALLDTKAWWGAVANSWWGDKGKCLEGST
ncbi:peptidase S41 family protein [Arthroderma uncinatum]|uniref:peptidase S41 family protein n=1 Tax=Arthroderma uncinatum TaxID=74035 RepID=UPI00144AD0D8|nr:peptidase S41 family protein [Arthroderma uncinatum]KAF3483077.1 peptidase S41 family protein [Arthroderma uncinatum]